MPDLTSLPHHLDAEKRQCRAIIETPKHGRNKFNYDPESGLFELASLLPEGMLFPFDFGFIPSTLGEDGDPLDVMVLMDEPAHVGCLVELRILGVIEAEQTGDGKTLRNDRVLAAAVHSYSYEEITSIGQLNKSLVSQIEQFFVTYNHQHGKTFKIVGRGEPERALRLIEDGIDAFTRERPAPPQ
ncbi:MAG: inorganic pyrophosphatase [Bryobacterales bacterium]|jgi:inorganic pyrophosphatase|nr:inorganic pyrophosphatase [Bryobacterales bacterium]